MKKKSPTSNQKSSDCNYYTHSHIMAKFKKLVNPIKDTAVTGMIKNTDAKKALEVKNLCTREKPMYLMKKKKKYERIFETDKTKNIT